jgi:DNA-directed RNA polymerase alpha subunit
MTKILRSFNILDNNFINSYKKKTGFWYTFKRSVNNLENLFIIFRYFESYEGKSWFKRQEEISNKLINAKLLNPSREKINASANARGLKKVFELLGFCFVDHDEKLKITEAGVEFLKTEDDQKRYEIKTKQLLKYQINNPLIKSDQYKKMQIKPFVFLLELLFKLDNQSINSTEYKLFVSRAHEYSDLQDVIDQINCWRILNEDSKTVIINQIKKSDIYQKLSGYNAYGMIFFGQSKYTEVSSFEDEKIIFLKQNKIEEVSKILKKQDISKYKDDIKTFDKFMNYYGNLENKQDIGFDSNKIIYDDCFSTKSIAPWKDKLKQLTNDEKNRFFLNKKIEELFFLSVRTLNALKNENIFYLKDLLIWQIQNLKQMRGMGQSSTDELNEQLKAFNKKNNTSLDFTIAKKIEITPITKNLFTKIKDIDFSVRTMNFLKNNHITFIGDLVTKTQSYLLCAPNFGQKSLNEIKSVLDGMSLYLGMDIVWPPEDIDILSLKSTNKYLKFDDLNNENQINFFIPIESIFDNTRIINACMNLEIKNLGDLHQKINTFSNKPNLGSRSIDEIKITLLKYISIPIGAVIEDWDITKSTLIQKYTKKLENKEFEESNKDFKNFQYLDEEINELMKKINYKRQDIIEYHYGLDGSGIKTLGFTGQHFGLTRERIRQIVSKYLRIIAKRKISGFIILKKINELLIQLCPISCINFEKYLLDNAIVKNRYHTRTLLSLIKLFLNKDDFILLEKKSIIDNKKNLKYSILKNFVFDNFNNYGILRTAFLSKKFKLTIDQIFNLLNSEIEISFIEKEWLYDNSKSRNRLYNTLQKIFNVSSVVNKFHIMKAIKRNTRLKESSSINFEAVSNYCKIELKAKIDDFNISVPGENIFKFFDNSQREILSPTELAFINVFKNEKILTYNQILNKLMDQGTNTNTASVYITNTPVITKVAPACYSLVGTKLDAGEIDSFYKKNKGKGAKIISDYDHNDDGSIWIGYEINERTRSGKNFVVENSLYSIIKGKYNVDGMNHKINIVNKFITRVGNEIFQDKLKLGDEIIFTFNLNRNSVQIDIGEKIMQKKYN